MRKMQLALFGFGLLVMLVVVGCKDDCAICPEPEVTPLGHAQGSLILAPGATIPHLEIFGSGAIAPNLDSAKVGDSLIGWQFWSMMSNTPYADAHWRISYHETGDASTFMYDHGDLATIMVWGSGRSAACQLKILEPGTAAVLKGGVHTGHSRIIMPSIHHLSSPEPCYPIRRCATTWW